MKVKSPTKEYKIKDKEYFLWVPVAVCLLILILALGSAYLIYNYTDVKGLLFPNNKDDGAVEEDELKVQIYLLESHYYLEEIDKEESYFKFLSNDFNKFTTLAASKRPDCLNSSLPANVLKPAKDDEEKARNSIEYFRHILNSWISNVEYMDLDKTLSKLLNEYQDLYFNKGDWKEEKVDKRFNELKQIYENELSKIEECAMSTENGIKQLEKLREKVKSVNEKLDEKWFELKKLDEELFKIVNKVIPEKAVCLLNFPFRWEDVQREKILAEREIDVLRFKLKQIRYKIMVADTKDKVNFLVKWEESFSNDKLEKHMQYIDHHYKAARKLQNNSITEIKNCFNKHYTL